MVTQSNNKVSCMFYAVVSMYKSTYIFRVFFVFFLSKNKSTYIMLNKDCVKLIGELGYQEQEN